MKERLQHLGANIQHFFKRPHVRNTLKYVLYVLIALPAAPFATGCWQVMLYGSTDQQTALIVTITLVVLVVRYIRATLRIRAWHRAHDTDDATAQ